MAISPPHKEQILINRLLSISLCAYMRIEIYPHKYNKYKPGNMEIFKHVLSKLSVSGQTTIFLVLNFAGLQNTNYER